MPKVLVIGDSCTDIFEYGKCDRISPEAPVPILIPSSSKETTGMTMNVWSNLIALGVNSDYITNSDKPIKKRFIEEISNHMLLRVDRNDNVQPLDWSILNDINWENYDAVIICDYNKGFLDNEQINHISISHPLTFMDSKRKLGEWANNIKYLKLNTKETNENWDYLHNLYPNNIITTKGNEGAVLNFRNVFLLDMDDFHQVRDLSGAGDTFLAGLVVEFLKTNNIFQAIEFANKCASWVVTQRGITIVDPTKI